MVPSSTSKHTPVNHPSGIPAVWCKSTTKKENAMSEWDGWPNRKMEQVFMWEEFEATSQLMSHWAVKAGGGD